MSSALEAIEPASEGQRNVCGRCRHFDADPDLPHEGHCRRWTWMARHWVEVDREDTCADYRPAHPAALQWLASIIRVLERWLLVHTGHARDEDMNAEEAEAAKPIRPRVLAQKLTTGRWGERRGRMLARLSRRLQGTDAAECLAALEAVIDAGPGAAELHDLVAPLVRHADGQIRADAFRAMHALDAGVGLEQTALLDALRDADEHVQHALVDILESVPNRDPLVVTALHELARSSSGYFAARVLKLLLELAPDDPRTVPRLFELLSSGDSCDAARLLAGPLAEHPGVIAWVDVTVREWSHAPRARQLELLESLERLARANESKLRAKLAPIAVALPDAEPELCVAILEVLSLDPAEFAAALPRTRALVTDPDPALASRALHALARIGTPAGALVAEIQAGLTRPEREVRSAAAEALQELGPAALPALPQVIGLLRRAASPALDDDLWYELARLTQIIRAIGPAAAPAVPVLLEWLAPGVEKLRYVTPFYDFRSGVLHALGAIGRAAEPAVPRILALVDDPWNRYSAARALYALDPNRSEFRTTVLEAGIDWPPPH